MIEWTQRQISEWTEVLGEKEGEKERKKSIMGIPIAER